jgi:uncharacterized protein
MTGAAAQATDGGPRRLRSLHPLVDVQGRCTLLYDLERTFVIEVPKPFQRRILPALATGELSARMLEWLDDNDLRTLAAPPRWGEGANPALPGVTDVSFDMSGACNMGCVYCFEEPINSRIGPMSDETAQASLDFVFEKTAAAKHIALHFGSGEPLMRFDLLKRIVARANARTAALGKSIVYDLTTNATLVTEEIAAFLRDNPFQIRVSCDGPPHLHDRYRPMRGGRPSYPLVERGLSMLVRHLADRLTVNTVICGGTRLAEVWAWAKQAGIRHYHVIKVGTAHQDDIRLQQAELQDFRSDLETICDDLIGDLRAGQIPVDYQPITKVVRRLMIPEPITRFCGVAGSYLGVSSSGQVYPCFRHLGLSEYRLGDVRTGVIDDERRRKYLGEEAADVDSRPVCRECWARYLCGGGCYADSVVYGADKRKPQETHCPFWRLEIETAIAFYDRLRREDPAWCFRLFGDDVDDIVGDTAEGPRFLKRKNCQ